jgi:small subunit ribosomal protein S1
MATNKKLLEELVDKASSQTKSQVSTINDAKSIVKKNVPETSVSPMEALLEQQPLHIPEVGDVLPGVVIDIAAHSILLDLGAFGTGIVLGKEMKDGLLTAKVRVGDAVTATLIDLENEDGYIELSIREASYEKAWEDIEVKRTNKDVVATKVLEANKGGLMVEINGITGFLPVSQLASEHYPRVEDGDKNKILELLKRLIGQELSVRILDADRVAEKLIVSEKAAQSERDRALIGQLAVGDIIEGDVSGVVDFGAFVKFEPRGARKGQKLEGLVHISELAWQLIDNPREIVKTGDHVRAKVIGVEDTRISLSIKVLKEDPWANVKDRYNVGDIVTGKVDKINHFGAFVYLDQDIHGLAHVSEFHEVFPKKKMEELFAVGQEYQWKILSIEPRTHRMGLLPVK